MDVLKQEPAAPAGASRRRSRPTVSVGLARTDPERRAAQRLRWRVFADEMGARLSSREPGLDCDDFDPLCEHLVARDDETGEIVGTYRILSPKAADRIGCYYSEGEFDLSSLHGIRDGMVEVGRSCVHPGFRTGAVIALLWSALARYILDRGYRYLAGCASASLADGGHSAAALYEHVRQRHLAPPQYRVTPRCPLPLERLDASVPASAPPLIKGYLRAGAYICGKPAWDPDFNTADFFVLLPLARVEERYARHFIDHARCN